MCCLTQGYGGTMGSAWCRSSIVYQPPKWPSSLCRELANVDLAAQHDLGVSFRVRDSIFGTFGIHKSNVRTHPPHLNRVGKTCDLLSTRYSPSTNPLLTFHFSVLCGVCVVPKLFVLQAVIRYTSPDGHWLITRVLTQRINLKVSQGGGSQY